MNSFNFLQLSPAAQKQRFHQEHGPECYRAPDGCAFYYADGAVLEEGGGPDMFMLHSPPDPVDHQGEYLLYWRKLQFARLKLVRAIATFDELNTILAHSLPGDEEGELAKLKALQVKVDERKKIVALAEAALANTRRGKAEAARRLAQEEETRRIQEWQSKRSAIRI